MSPPADRPVPTQKKIAQTATCKDCGHLLSRHRVYARHGRRVRLRHVPTDVGVNRHDWRLVCIAENCQHWTGCHD
jgi:hypothetical protein